MSARAEAAFQVLLLAWRGVVRRPLPSALTALAVALGVGLVVAVDALSASADRSYREAAGGYDVILGPPHGSPLQAVLSTLFHADEPGGVLPWAVYEEARADPRVAAAVPYAIGDTFRGAPVVGTSEQMFTVLADRQGRAIGDGILGRLFRPETLEAVVGSAVAGRADLALGQTFRIRHAGGAPHAEDWSVVGVLRPTGTPHDRAIYIPIETFYRIPGHEAAFGAGPGGAPPAGGPAAGEAGEVGAGEEGAGEVDQPGEGQHGDEEHAGEEHQAEEQQGEEHQGEEHQGEEHQGEEHGRPGPRVLSAVGIRLRSPGLRLIYLQEFRTGRTDAQAILPADQVRKLLAVVGDVNEVVRWIAWLVTIVAAVTVLVGLYDTIHGRRGEIAVLRALGARPRHVFAWILLEALLLCLVGGVAGILLGHLGVAVAAPSLLEAYGVEVGVGLRAHDFQVLAVLLGLGVLAGLLPAWRGLTSPVAENLESPPG